MTEHTLSSQQNQLLVVLVTMTNLANKTILQRKSRKINTNNKTNIGANNRINNGQTRTRNGQYDIIMYHTSGQDLIPITGIKRP